MNINNRGNPRKSGDLSSLYLYSLQRYDAPWWEVGELEQLVAVLVLLDLHHGAVGHLEVLAQHDAITRQPVDNRLTLDEVLIPPPLCSRLQPQLVNNA